MKSIRAKLITLLLCCVILSSAIIGVVCILQTAPILQETSKDNMVLLCEKNARALNTVFDNIENSVETLAHYMSENLPDPSTLHSKSGSELEDYFAKIKQVGINHASSLPNAVAVYAVFDPATYGETGFFYQTNESGMLTAHSLPALPIAGKADADWWNTPIQTASPTWISKGWKKVNTDETRIFTYAVPIYVNNALLAVVGMDFSYDLLQSMISGIQTEQIRLATLLDRDRLVIAPYDMVDNVSIDKQNEDLAPIKEEIQNTQSAAFATGKYDLDQALSHDLYPYELNDEELVLSFCTLQNGMILCLSTTADEIYSYQNSLLHTTVFVILVVSLVTIVITVLFASRLSAPIIELNRSARLFTKGDLNTPVIPTTKDEIGELAASFEKTRLRMKSYIDDLYREAHIDGLTGAHNNSAFADVEKEMNARIKAGEDVAFCAVLLDVNYLKITNDTFGHIAGDELLQKVATCMKNTFGPQNVFRVGGDEFAALIYTQDAAEGAEQATQCIAEIEQEKLTNYPDIPISCAMGVATFQPHVDESMSEVFARADAMMYKNKVEEKKRTPFWKKDLQSLRQVQIERYLEFLKLLDQSMDSYMFLLDIESNKNWFFNNVNEKFAICAEGSPTNTLEEMMAIVHPADREELAADLQRIADGTSREHNMNYRWLDREGTPVWVNCHGKVINDANGKPFLMIGRVSDTVLLPWYNPLTGLFNKDKLLSDFRNHTIVPFRRFVLINVNDLSHTNLKYGRRYGDEILRRIANVLSQNFPNKAIYHLEKDHFALLLDSQNEDTVRQHVQTIRDAVNDTTSLSVAVIPNERQYYADIESLYEYACHLLKSSGANGSETTTFFTTDDFAKTLSNIDLIEELETSIYENDCAGFYLCYQPQVDARTHEVVSAEALLRYHSKKNGRLYPDAFIPLLERTQMICEVGLWVLRTAIEQCAKWRDLRPDMGISVNISPIQFRNKDLTDTVLSLLTEHDLPADALTLELTENVELENTAHLENFAKLRSAGVHISIDDFGTGYANLSYLQKVHADELKIDHTFIKDIRQGSFHHTLISNIATFAKNNGIFVCMEGVETPEELAVLELSEPNVLQGYLFDKPLVATEFEARYVTPEKPIAWKFAEELQKQRERVRFAYFNSKDILANIKTGLWMLRLDEKTGEGMLYADDTSRQIIGLDAPLAPAHTYELFMDRLPQEEYANLQQLLEIMRTDSRVIQLKFNWDHPLHGNVRMRITGKFVGTENGISTYEGFLRNLSDQYDIQKTD